MTDLRLPDSDGISTFLSNCNQNSLIPIIILTGLKDETIGTYAIKEGAHDYLVKGQTESRLVECIIQW
jgi:FixJ family two-component response regulator